MSVESDLSVLKREVLGLLQYIQRVRLEIAAINRPPERDHDFNRMSDQLDAIVESTEHATESIMEKMEQNAEILGKLRKTLKDPNQLALVDKMLANGNEVFEACSFQDLTGQRVSKVVKSITYVEDRVNALTEIWGRDELEKVQVHEEEKSADEKLLHGPKLKGDESISQDEIDKLFD